MTERSNNPKPKEKKAMKKSVASMKNVAKTKEPVAPAKKPEAKPEEKGPVKEEEKKETKAEKKTTSAPKAKKKKDKAVVNAQNLHISTKKATDVCRFIKGKRISNAQDYLEKVMVKKKAIPMKGEIAHRKGKMMSGGFPYEASKEFIILLKGLAGNAMVNGIDDPVIVEAVANMASRPFGRFGRVQKKRTHVRLVARKKKERSLKNKKKKRSKK